MDNKLDSLEEVRAAPQLLKQKEVTHQLEINPNASSRGERARRIKFPSCKLLL